MKRNIITIDEDKCNGCGICVTACHEGAIQMVGGKAKLVTESYCDGLGDCLPECPTGAITMENREAPEYDEAAVKENMAKKKAMEEEKSSGCSGGCPGSSAHAIHRAKQPQETLNQTVLEKSSELTQWPVQIKLAPVNAPYFNGAKLLIAADCTAFAYGNIHQDFIKGRVTLIGCPKLDMIDYANKLTEIIKLNDIKSVSVLRMSVPCCGGIVQMVKQAMINSGKMLPWNVTVVTPDGELIEQ